MMEAACEPEYALTGDIIFLKDYAFQQSRIHYKMCAFTSYCVIS